MSATYAPPILSQATGRADGGRVQELWASGARSGPAILCSFDANGAGASARSRSATRRLAQNDTLRPHGALADQLPRGAVFLLTIVCSRSRGPELPVDSPGLAPVGKPGAEPADLDLDPDLESPDAARLRQRQRHRQRRPRRPGPPA